MRSHLGLSGQYCCSNLHSSSEYWRNLQHSNSRTVAQEGPGCPGWCRHVRVPPSHWHNKLKPCRHRLSRTHSLSSHSLCSCNVKLREWEKEKKFITTRLHSPLVHFFIVPSRGQAYTTVSIQNVMRVPLNCGHIMTCRHRSLVFSRSSQTALKSDPSLQMNPDTQGGDSPARRDRQSETQQGERAPAKSPMQHSAPFLSRLFLIDTESRHCFS